MTQGLGGRSHQNANVAALLKEFQSEYGSYGGDNPGIQTLITYKVLKSMAGGSTGGSSNTSGGVASTVTIRGSTGQTVLTDAEGRVVVANVANLLGRLPSLVDGRIPVGVVFPQNQIVTVSNLVTDGAKESSLTALLQRIPQSANNRLPVGVEFPSNQQVTVSNQFATQQTLTDVLNRIPTATNGKFPVSVDFPSNFAVTVSNQITGFATEQTLTSLLARLTDIIEGRASLEVDFPAVQHILVDNPITNHATEETLSNLLARTPTLTNGKIPVVATLPDGVTVNNQISGFSTEATLSALLAKTLAPVDGKLPVSLAFPSNQNVTVSNQVTDGAKDATVASILARLPQLSNGKTPVAVDFPSLTIANQITGFSTEATLANILSKLPSLTTSGKSPVDVAFPTNQQVTVSNQLTGFSSEATLASVLAKLPTLTTSGKTPVDLDISALSKDSTLAAILAKLPTLTNGKSQVIVDFPSNQTVTVSNPSDMSALGKDATLTAILNKLPTLTTNNKTPVDVTFPTNQTVTVSNPTAATDVSALGKDSSLTAILNKLPALANGKTPIDVDLSALGKDASLAAILARLPALVNGKSPVVLDFPANQTVTVSNPTAAPDVSGLSKEATLAAVLAKLPTLVNGKTPVDFPANQTVTVSNPSDVSLLGREATLNAILNRLPTDISRAIAQGFRTEFTTASPLATALTATPLGDSPLWSVARTKKVEGLDAFSQTFLGRRPSTFAANGFTDIAEFELQTVGNNLRSPTLVGTQTLEIVSSNAADNANGTGVRTVEVMYLDEGFNLKATSVTLTGTVPAQLQLAGVAIKPTCILEVQATTYGSAQGAAGNVTVRIPAGGLLTSPVIVDQISQGDTTSLTARCCVPEGYVGYLTDVSGTAITANHEFRLMATVAQSDKRLLDGVFNTIDLFSVNAGTIPVERTLANIELPSRCRVRLVSRASAATASASGDFTVVFVKKPA